MSESFSALRLDGVEMNLTFESGFPAKWVITPAVGPVLYREIEDVADLALWEAANIRLLASEDVWLPSLRWRSGSLAGERVFEELVEVPG